MTSRKSQLILKHVYDTPFCDDSAMVSAFEGFVFSFLHKEVMTPGERVDRLEKGDSRQTPGLDRPDTCRPLILTLRWHRPLSFLGGASKTLIP